MEDRLEPKSLKNRSDPVVNVHLLTYALALVFPHIFMSPPLLSSSHFSSSAAGRFCLLHFSGIKLFLFIFPSTYPCNFLFLFLPGHCDSTPHHPVLASPVPLSSLSHSTTTNQNQNQNHFLLAWFFLFSAI